MYFLRSKCLSLFKEEGTDPLVDCELHILKGKDKKAFSFRLINAEIGKSDASSTSDQWLSIETHRLRNERTGF